MLQNLYRMCVNGSINLKNQRFSGIGEESTLQFPRANKE